ncbi:MAG: hypothetical protein ABJN35_04505 [Erythrobacter sp.]|uniref:hypothetical protein n=1 Tax=Erythrobacter sp. Alg231-14 TaxID=1922225 RepID=UPI000D557DF9
MNTFKNMIAALLVASTAAMPIAAHAQNSVDVSGDVKAVETSVDEAGNETTQLVEPGVIIPGGRLVFGTDYTNNSDEPAENFVVTNPLPTAVRLAPDADPDLIVSVDGGNSWGTLASLSIANEDGSTRTAAHADVTHVRWTLASIAPGESGRLEYPAIIR